MYAVAEFDGELEAAVYADLAVYKLAEELNLVGESFVLKCG